MHGNVDQVIADVRLQVRHVIVSASYLFGYLSKTEQRLSSEAPRATQEIALHPEMGMFIERLEQKLEALHEQYPNFTSLEVFDPISELVHDMYKKAGLTFTLNEDGRLRVDITPQSGHPTQLAGADRMYVSRFTGLIDSQSRLMFV